MSKSISISIVLLVIASFAIAQQLPPTPSFPRPPQQRVPTTGLSHSGLSSVGSRPGGGYAPPKTYSDYYSANLKQHHRTGMSARDYTIEKHFYHRPTVSPYLNLTRRPSSTGLGNYQTYVRPELNRRSAASAANRAKRPPSAKFSPYYDKMYGSR